MKKHPRMLEAIEKAKVAAVSNRGMYPITMAANVYKQDGTPLEEKNSGTNINPDIPEPDVVVDPVTTPIVEVIKEIESGAVIAVADGEVAENLTLDKGVIIQGVNAGIPQNHKQEV